MSSQTVVVQRIKDTLENWMKWGFDEDEAKMILEDMAKEWGSDLK